MRSADRGGRLHRAVRMAEIFPPEERPEGPGLTIMSAMKAVFAPISAAPPKALGFIMKVGENAGYKPGLISSPRPRRGRHRSSSRTTASTTWREGKSSMAPA